MAIRYVWSGATGSGNGSSWANAHTTLAAAITASTAGDDFRVAHDHSESTAAVLVLTFKGSASAPDTCYVVDRAGSVPPVAADLPAVGTAPAIVATTGSGSNILVNGQCEFYGITFRPGVGNAGSARFDAASAPKSQKYVNCRFELNTQANSTFARSSGYGSVRLENCTIKFGNSAQTLASQNAAGTIIWNNQPSIPFVDTSGTIPTYILAVNVTDSNWTFDGLDLTAFGSGKTLVGQNDRGGKVNFLNCRLDASVAISQPQANPEMVVDLRNSNSTSGGQRNERHSANCVLTTETTIRRTGGAAEPGGGNPYCWKLTPTSTLKRQFAFQTFDMLIWNSDVGSPKTVTVHVVTDNVTLKDDEIWLEVDYLSNSGYPISSSVSDGPATVLTVGANQASDSGTAWTTTGLAAPLKQKLEVTFTPQMAGLIRVRVRYGKASTVVYICPKPDLT